MLKLPTNIGEWGFVIVLSVLFMGLAFAIIYSQIHLHGMRKEQAYRDTESNLYVMAETVRSYQRDHGSVETSLLEMGLPDEALETRHATISESTRLENGMCTISATLLKYGEPTCTLTFSLDNDVHAYTWSE